MSKDIPTKIGKEEMRKLKILVAALVLMGAVGQECSAFFVINFKYSEDFKKYIANDENTLMKSLDIFITEHQPLEGSRMGLRFFDHFPYKSSDKEAWHKIFTLRRKYNFKEKEDVLAFYHNINDLEDLSLKDLIFYNMEDDISVSKANAPGVTIATIEKPLEIIVDLSDEAKTKLKLAPTQKKFDKKPSSSLFEFDRPPRIESKPTSSFTLPTFPPPRDFPPSSSYLPPIKPQDLFTTQMQPFFPRPGSRQQQETNPKGKVLKMLQELRESFDGAKQVVEEILKELSL